MRARDNPFAVHRVLAVRYRCQDCSWDELLSRLEALNYRAAICGNEGSGKTTLLEDLAARLGQQSRVAKLLRLSRQQPSFPPGFLSSFARQLDRQHVVLLDGAEQLGRLGWRRFLSLSQKAGGAIITSHRPGLLPTLVHCRTSPRLLHEIVRQLLGDQSLDWHPLTDSLFEKHRGNIRDVLRDLYDLCASGGLNGTRGNPPHSSGIQQSRSRSLLPFLPDHP